MQDININEIWIDVETLAKLKNITKRAVRLSLNQNKYEYKIDSTRGGKTYKIKLSSLEEDLQTKYIQDFYMDFKNTNNEIIKFKNLNIKQEKLISKSQKKMALAKYDLVFLWLDFRKSFKFNKLKTSKNTPDNEFLNLYNTGMFHEEIFKILGSVSIGSLYRWRTQINYNNDWTALVGQYKYSTRKEYRTTLNEEQIKIFIQILLLPSSFSIGKAISLTKHILKERGFEILPKDITFRRYAEWFRDNNFDKWTLARDGEKALKDKVSPFIVRNASLLKAVKEHFKIEDLDLIEKELLFEDIKPKIEPVKKIQAKPKREAKKEFEPKVKTSIVARPIFKNNYERYEWHMKNGCICNDDRVWLAKYIQSDEYKEIYN